jgi:hypothetical protein
MEKHLFIKLFIKSLFSFLIFFPTLARSAACCGGGFSSAAVITNDDLAFLSSSVSYTKIDTDVFANGVWQKRSGDDASKILKLDYAHILGDRYQCGLSVPLQTRTKSGIQGGESTGLGDIATQLGYEYLPDWDYNPWRPHGVGFISLTLPTGLSIYDTENESALDVRGRGFWTLSLGTSLNKSWQNWDASSSFEVHQSLNRSARTNQMSGTVKPEMGASFSVGSGYNFKDFRIGQAILWNYEGAIDVDGSQPSQGSVQRNATSTTSFSYVFKDNFVGSLNYSDQTLFGSPTNTSLTKSIAFSLQKKWAR